MQKFCRIAIAVSISFGLTFNASAFEKPQIPEELPVLSPESQHATASKRITARFTRAHYKKVTIDDALSNEVFDRYIKQLDYARNVFLAEDIDKFEQYRDDFETLLKRCLLYTSPSPRDKRQSRMPSSA